MALKLKMDGEHAVLQNGLPVWVDDSDGKELAFDAEQMTAKITALNSEAAGHRHKAKEMAEKLALFGDTDPTQVAAFKKTLEEYGGPEGLAELKKRGAVDVEAVKKSLVDSYEGKLADLGKTVETLTARERQLLVGNGIATSQFLGKTTFKDTRDVAEAYFGSKFKVENGKAVAYDGDEPVFSRANPGHLASIDEALEYFVSKHPQRDSFLLGSGGGSGAGNPGGGGKNTKVMTRAEIDSKDPAFRMDFFKNGGTLTD